MSLLGITMDSVNKALERQNLHDMQRERLSHEGDLQSKRIISESANKEWDRQLERELVTKKREEGTQSSKENFKRNLAVAASGGLASGISKGVTSALLSKSRNSNNNNKPNKPNSKGNSSLPTDPEKLKIKKVSDWLDNDSAVTQLNRKIQAREGIINSVGGSISSPTFQRNLKSVVQAAGAFLGSPVLSKFGGSL